MCFVYKLVTFISFSLLFLVGASKVAFIWLSTWFWFVHWWQIATSVIWRISNASLFMHLAQVGMLPRRIITLGKELGWTKTHGYDHNQFDGSTNREEETKHQWMDGHVPWSQV